MFYKQTFLCKPHGIYTFSSICKLHDVYTFFLKSNLIVSFMLISSAPLIDVVVAAQTSAGQEAMMEFLDFSDTYDITLPERYLLAACFSTHPTENLLQDLLVSFKH